MPRDALRSLIRQLRARPLACFAVAFLLGLLGWKEAQTAAIAFSIALAIPACLGFSLRNRRGALAALVLLAGLLSGMGRMALALNAIPSVETRYSVDMTGRVVSEPYTNPDTGRRICQFAVETENGEPSDLRLRLYLRGEDEERLSDILYGQRLRLTGHIWSADPVTNPYEFDFGDYLNRQGLSAYATAKIEDVELLDVRRDVRSALIDARQAVAARIDALFPGNAGLMRALVLGDRSLLGDELRDALSRSGTAHLISISGLHVTLLCAMLSLVLARFMPRRWANLVAILLLLPYGAMIGMNAPFVRALVMFALLCFAPVAGRASDGVTRLGAALLLWLAVKPLSVCDAGFALSFSASAGILMLMPTISRAVGLEALRRKKPSPSRLRRVARKAALYLPALLCASLAAQLATLPFVIAFFGVQSVVSLPFNLICVPLCMVGYVSGLIALLVSLVSVPAAMLLARVPDALFAWLVAVTRYSARIPAASVRIGRYPAPLVLLHWAVVFMASDLCPVRFSRRRFTPLTIVAIAGLSTLLTFAGSWRYSITFLDAGQADCAVVRTRGHTYLIDAGDTYTPAADYLNATCLRLDGVLLTHPHQDHAGGLADVLESFTPDAIYVPAGWFDVEEVAPAVTEGIELARNMGVPIRELSAGDAIDLSKAATLEVYSPDGEALPKEVNDMSLLTLVTCEGQRALFTGDLSAEGEPEVIPDADVLKVAHHGSAKGTSQRFLNACTPEIAVISVGENNYGHPAPETLEKLNASGAAVYETRRYGAIRLTWTGGAWRTETYLEGTDEVE